MTSPTPEPSQSKEAGVPASDRVRPPYSVDTLKMDFFQRLDDGMGEAGAASFLDEIIEAAGAWALYEAAARPEPPVEGLCETCGRVEDIPDHVPAYGDSLDGVHEFKPVPPPVEGALTKGTLMHDPQEQVDAPGTDSAVAPLEEMTALEFARWQTGGVAGDLVPGAVEAWAAAIDKRDRYNRASVQGGE